MTDFHFVTHTTGVAMVRNGRHAVVMNDQPNFSYVMDVLRSLKGLRGEALEAKLKDLDKVMTVGGLVESFGQPKDHKLKDCRVFVEKGKLFYSEYRGHKQELHGALAERILQDLGKPSKAFARYGDALMRFMQNIRKNKVKDIRNELYEWLMSGKAPITYDGCFLAYKKVRSNFMDGHTGTIDNSPGNVVRMQQSEVDTNRENHCSVGLHFCSKGYLDHFGAGGASKIVIVKVNPRHVFAIPTDYKFQKGRASEYFVVGEYTGARNTDDGPVAEAFKDAFIDEDTKQDAMPDVKLVGWLRPSLENLAKSYGLLTDDGKVLILERRGRMVPVKQAANGKFEDIVGMHQATDDGLDAPKSMSLQTKSVRQAVRAAINKVEKGLTTR